MPKAENLKELIVLNSALAATEAGNEANNPLGQKIFTREQTIAQKMAAGWSREQAIQVLGFQEKEDRRVAEETKTTDENKRAAYAELTARQAARPRTGNR